MTQKTYVLEQMRPFGYRRLDDIPDEMLDYLPENMDLTDEECEERYLAGTLYT